MPSLSNSLSCSAGLLGTELPRLLWSERFKNCVEAGCLEGWTPTVGRRCGVRRAICSAAFPLTANMAPDKDSIFLGRLNLNAETIGYLRGPLSKRVPLKSVVANLGTRSRCEVEAPPANGVGQFCKPLSLQTTVSQLAVENFIPDVSRVIEGWPEFTVLRPDQLFNRSAIQRVYA